MKKLLKFLVAIGFGVAVAEARHRTGSASSWVGQSRPN